MIHAYDEIYLEDAMTNLGDDFEYAVLDCHYCEKLTNKCA